MVEKRLQEWRAAVRRMQQGSDPRAVCRIVREGDGDADGDGEMTSNTRLLLAFPGALICGGVILAAAWALGVMVGWWR